MVLILDVHQGMAISDQVHSYSNAIFTQKLLFFHLEDMLNFAYKNDCWVLEF